ncbi:uncharacterized protein LOC112684254 isoform X2 [Sipha flava]|nr:uncharacterized protein LOC112684254 isoform X2 [Sipha flava]XP_025411459.1 uncharacterized protein LOC112684254 isoform X2 [Sipha flava]
MEISDVLGLVGKKWSIYRVSPLWNLQFKAKYLKSISEQLKDYITSNLKKHKQVHSFSNISVEIEAKEVHDECIALKIQVIYLESNILLYTGVLLKSPNYSEKYNMTKLSEMPVLMVQGNTSFILAVHEWLAEHFDCIIRPYEFANYQVLWLIAISMADAGTSYNNTVSYHYLFKYELSKGKMDVKCSVESEFLRSTLSKISLIQSLTSEENSFHYSHLIKIHAEIEDHFKMTSGINVSKLKLIAFEAPKVVSINVSGKIRAESSTLMDLIMNYIMELVNKSL